MSMRPQEKELIRKIVEITSLIQEKYPELVYELEEYNYYTGAEKEPLALKANPEIDYASLSSYLESLKETVKHYINEKGKGDLFKIEHV
jgi:hypothetical protein